MQKSTQTPYIIIVIGLGLFALGMLIDVVEHGIDFLISEFRTAPWSHGMPLAGILLVTLGTLLELRRGRG